MAVPGYTPKAVSAAGNNGSGLIRLTVPSHGLAAGHSVLVKGVGGVANANSTWWDLQGVHIVNANQIDLPGSSYSGSFTSGGTVARVERWSGAQVGEYVAGSNPAKFVLPTVKFSLDGDVNNLSAAELGVIQGIWKAVSEDYAPFNVDVTTKEPSPWDDDTDLRIVFDDHGGNLPPVLGGTGTDWFLGVPQNATGYSQFDSFSDSAPNVSWVWVQNHSTENRVGRHLGSTAAHEAGHALNLQHVSHADPWIEPGYLMSNSSNEWGFARTSWSTLGFSGVSGISDDLGFSTDDHGDTIASATAAGGSAGFSVSGLLGRHWDPQPNGSPDVDMVSFATPAGTVSLGVDVIADRDGDEAYYANLDAKLTLLDSTGAQAKDAGGKLIPIANPAGEDWSGWSPRTTAYLSAGTYYLKIEGAGLAGDMGRYTAWGVLPHSSPSTAIPRVAAVVVRNSGGTHGDYTVPSGSGQQLRSIPVGGGVNQISISFSEHVSVQQDDLLVARGGGYGSNVAFTSFNYSGGTLTATWTFAAIASDQLRLTLKGTGAGAVADFAGNALDGEWTNPTSMGQTTATSMFPSGNGSAGGDFVFYLAVLGGDFDRDGDVDSNNPPTETTDYGMLNHFFGVGTGWWQGDADGDGTVDLDDFGVLQANLGKNYKSWP